MCEPTTILLIASTVATVAQGYQARQQAKSQAKYEEGVAQYNARTQENEATKIANKGIEAENEQRRRVAEAKSAQLAQFGASGVDPLTGSALKIQEETETLGEIDALRVRSRFLDQAESLRAQAGLTQSEGEAKAGFTRAKGQAAFTGSIVSAVGQVAGSGVASKWFTPNSAAVVSSQGTQPVLSGGGGAPVFEAA